MNSADTLLEELKRLALSINRDDLRKLVLELLEEPRLSFSSAKPLISLVESPAAPRKHHLFPSGLLLHTLAVTRLALAIARIVEEVYGIQVDRDIVVASSILHDIYKVFQYEPDPVNGGYRPRSDWYLSHDYALVAELAARHAEEKLIRVCSEVHGTAPITTVEGLIVHLADSIDARLGELLQNQALARAKEVEALHGCKHVSLIIEAMKRYGIQRILRMTMTSPADLRNLLESICIEQKQSTTNQPPS